MSYNVHSNPSVSCQEYCPAIKVNLRVFSSWIARCCTHINVPHRSLQRSQKPFTMLFSALRVTLCDVSEEPLERQSPGGESPCHPWQRAGCCPSPLPPAGRVQMPAKSQMSQEEAKLEDSSEGQRPRLTLSRLRLH